MYLTENPNGVTLTSPTSQISTSKVGAGREFMREYRDTFRAPQQPMAES